VDIVENILLALLRAAREGNWLLQLSAIHNMIPWCVLHTTDLTMHDTYQRIMLR